jgi:hypothetical protein
MPTSKLDAVIPAGPRSPPALSDVALMLPRLVLLRADTCWWFVGDIMTALPTAFLVPFPFFPNEVALELLDMALFRLVLNIFELLKFLDCLICAVVI